jgi:hypothetical protein
VVRNKASLVA